MLGGINNTLFFTSFAGFAVMGLFIILLKWAFSRGSSLVEKPKKIGDEDEYGLLKVVASPSNFVEGKRCSGNLKKLAILSWNPELIATLSIFIASKDEEQI